MIMLTGLYYRLLRIAKLCFVVLFCGLLVSQPIFAATQTKSSKTDFFMRNSIYVYDGILAGCVDSSSSGAAGVDFSGSENAKIILQYLTSKGLTLAAASGLVGNMMQESGLNPKRKQGGGETTTLTNGVGYGLVQWTFSDRQSKLKEIAASMGKSVGDISVQLEMVWYELTHGWKSTLVALNNRSLSPEDAAIIAHGRTQEAVKTAPAGDVRFKNAPTPGYEASGDNAPFILKVRGGNAKSVYEKYKSQIKDGNGVDGVALSTDATTSTSSTSSNCASATATTGCSATKPITGAGSGGNGHQLTRTELVKIYGDPSPDTMSKKVVSVDFLGKSIKVHPSIAGCVKAVASEIQANNINYAIKSIGGYRYDSNNGSSNIGEKSYHTYGIAIDINPTTNPFIRGGSASYDMPQGYIDAFRNHGFSWGGDWNSVKDYMHFEFNGIDPAKGAST